MERGRGTERERERRGGERFDKVCAKAGVLHQRGVRNGVSTKCNLFLQQSRALISQWNI